MIEIAIASGKGGTGKTTVAVNLAFSSDQPVVLADCDVEEPNAHLFVKPEWHGRSSVTVLNPAFDTTKCVGTGACRDACRFNALILLGQKPLLFPELCHSCGACVLACPHQAVYELPREIGSVETGSVGPVQLIHGTLNVSEARSTPIIAEVKNLARRQSADLLIIDAPPGTSCPVIEAVRNADYVVLVTEPTPFGLNDLVLAVETVRQLGTRFGVIINRANIGDAHVQSYCAREHIKILAEIPYDKKAAELYARGSLLVSNSPVFRKIFRDLLETILKEIK